MRFCSRSWLIAWFCIWVGAFAQCVWAQKDKNDQIDNTLYIVQDKAWAPLAFANSDDIPQGLLIDLWRAVGEKIGRPVDIELVDWQYTLRLVRDSETRVHGGLFRSTERLAYLDFSEPLLQMRTTLFIRNDVSSQHLLEIKDLTTQVVGITAGGYEAEFMRVNHPRVRLQLFNNNEQLVRAAVRGDVGAFVADYPVGMHYLDQYTTPEKFRVLAVLYQQSIHAAVAKGNQSLLADVNAGLAEISSEQMTAITQKWLQSIPVSRLPSWLVPSIFIAILALVFMSLILHNKRLSSRVVQKSRELLEQQKHVMLLTQNMSDWVWTTDSRHHFTYVSPSVKKLLGYEAEELIGQHWGIILHPSENERANALTAHLEAAARRGEILEFKDVTVDICLRNKCEQIVWTEAATRLFFDKSGNFIGTQGNSRNITERKQAEEAIRQLAFNDPLTHLPNRRLFSDRLKQAMAGCSRHHQYCALFFLDLDNFKYINDNHGHDNGDALLQQVAQRLSASLRESDTIARFGGDEFALISEFLSLDLGEAKQQALSMAIKMLELFDVDFVIRDARCRLTSSMGIILFNNDEKSMATLIKQADLALYQAKANGRNQFFMAEI